MALYVHKYGSTSMFDWHPGVAAAAAGGRAPDGVFRHESKQRGRGLRWLGELSPEKSTPEVARRLDMIAATGEQVSVGLLAIAFAGRRPRGGELRRLAVPIRTDSAYTKARIESSTTRPGARGPRGGKVVIITGQGIRRRGPRDDARPRRL